MTSHSDSELKINQVTKLRKQAFKPKDKNFYLLKKRVQLEVRRNSLLKAVSFHDTERVRHLLKFGVSANTADRQLRSALHIASSRGYADIVDLLLEYGADPNNKDIIQNTPLHLAACTSNLRIITQLINSGANIRSLDIHGRNPLQLAESKLQMLQKSFKEGGIEVVQLRDQLKEIVDVMISLWKHKEPTSWGHHRDNVDDLELMKLSLSSGPVEEVDDQMTKLMSELQQFTIK